MEDLTPVKLAPAEMVGVVMVVVAVVATAALTAMQVGNTPLIEPDSESYLRFSGIRALGYPFFLHGLRSLGLPLAGVPWVQLALQLASIPVLYAVLRRSGVAAWLAGLTVLVGYVNPEVTKYHAKILTESLFLTVLVLFISALLLHVRERSRTSLLLASLFAAVCVVLKPVGWAMVALLALVTLADVVRDRRRWPLLLAFALPLVVVVGAERGASRVIHGPDRATLAGPHLFGKAAMIDAAVPDALLREGPNAVLHRKLEYDAEPIRRLIERAPNASIAQFLTVNYEVFLQTLFAARERAGIASRRDLTRALIETGLQRLRHGVPGYLALAGRHYIAVWTMYHAAHPADRQPLEAFLAAERPLPFEDQVPVLVAPFRSAGLKAVIARPLIAAAGVVTFVLAGVGLVALLRGRAIPLAWRQAGLLALGLHGYAALVALAGVGIPRYLLGVWPLLTTALGLAAAAVLAWLHARRARR